jgi:hypothetical protein
VDKDNITGVPSHILDLYKHLHTNPIASIWDYGFVSADLIKESKAKPIYERVTSERTQFELYYSTTDYDIFLIKSVDSFELYFLYDATRKDSVTLAANAMRKYKIKFEE